ncbi:MAG: DNA-3-methyladenine glycosylase [Prosthecobacter sp.]|nr:DNA-3-methyladenine glycosylase [Prosthecobacter sp.]
MKPISHPAGRIDRAFFQRDPVTCAQELIGCELVWNDCTGIIVETEAYAALGDEACHTFARPSARAFIASHAPGAAYVYFNYGMYWLFNVLVKGGSEDGFVLIRALEPVRGIDLMEQRRFPGKSGPVPAKSLCSGPGKLTIAMGIDGTDHGRDLCQDRKVGFHRNGATPASWVSDGRVGISKAAHFPWRFLAPESAFVSAKHGLLQRSAKSRCE